MRIRKSDKLKALAAVPLFADLSKKELEAVASLTTETSVEGGHTIASQGEVGREAMVLLDGGAVVRRNGRKVADIGAGSIVGEMSILEHLPRNATVVTTAPTNLLVMDAREFSSLMSSQPKVALKILKTVARRYADLDRKGL